MYHGKVIIEKTDNGWIVETDYFCYGHAQKRVFTKWSDVAKFVSEATRNNNGK